MGSYLNLKINYNTHLFSYRGHEVMERFNRTEYSGGVLTCRCLFAFSTMGTFKTILSQASTSFTSNQGRLFSRPQGRLYLDASEVHGY